MIRGHVNDLGRVRRIVPMADDVDVRSFVLHHAMKEPSLLRQTNGIHLAAGAANFAAGLASVLIAVGENDGGIPGPSGVFGVAIGDDVRKILVVAFGSSEAERFTIPVVGILGTGLEAEMRWRIVVPEPAGDFVAKVFRFN